MIPLVRCPNGHIFQSAFSPPPGARGTFTLSGNRETCPYCGAWSQTPNGVFKFGDEVLRAIKQPGVSREAVATFRDLTKAVQEGSTSAEMASEQLTGVSPTFATLLRIANENPAILVILFGLLQTILAYWAIVSSNEGAAQAHADAQAQLRATEHQTQAIQSAVKAQESAQQALQKIDAEVQQLNAAVEQATQSPPSTEARHIAHQAGTQQVVTRQQRRHAERQAAKRARQRRP